MKTIYYGASSINGFIADKNNSLNWLFQFKEDEGPDSYPAFIAGVGAMAMGSTTYEWLLENQIDKGMAWPYPMPTWVFTTRSLRQLPGADIRFVKGDVRPVHDQMKTAAGDKNIWIVGGGELVGKFYDEGLLDEAIWQLAPLTLEGGAPLFPRNAQPPFKLLSIKSYTSGFVELHYQVIKKR